MKTYIHIFISTWVFLGLFITSSGYSDEYNIAEERQSFEYEFYEWNNRMYELTGRLVLINDSKAIIHLPRRNYGYTKFIYTDVELDQGQLISFRACKNLCFISGTFSFSGNQQQDFGSEYQINSKMISFKMGLDESLIKKNRRLFSDLRKLDELFTSTSEKNDGRYPPTFFFEFGQEPKEEEPKEDD